MFFIRTLGAVLFGLAVAAGGCSTSPQEQQKKETRAMPQALETILQMTLDLEALNKYFHVDSLPERKPLRILKTPHIPESVRLEKFGASAVWTSAEDAKDKPVFEFSSVKVEESLASVAFRYPPEGIAGTIEFQKQEQQWVVTGSTIVEN